MTHTLGHTHTHTQRPACTCLMCTHSTLHAAARHAGLRASSKAAVFAWRQKDSLNGARVVRELSFDRFGRILIKNGTLRYETGSFCGASLIAPGWALTATHCTEDLQGCSISPEFGSGVPPNALAGGCRTNEGLDDPID